MTPANCQILGVHGINQQSFTGVELSREWAKAITSGLAATGRHPGELNVLMVYYASLFSERLTPQGLHPLLSEDESDLLAIWLRSSPVSVTPQGRVEMWVGQAAEAIAARLPRVPAWAVESMMRSAAAQASRYLREADLRKRIQALILSEVAQLEPRVLIAHSLGSVVAYETLHTSPETELELLLTIGSPLGTPGLFIPRLAPGAASTLSKPTCVRRWVNVYHPGDVVAATGKLLPVFSGIECDVMVEIEMRYCHSASAYLAAPEVASLLAEYL